MFRPLWAILCWDIQLELLMYWNFVAIDGIIKNQMEWGINKKKLVGKNWQINWWNPRGKWRLLEDWRRKLRNHYIRNWCTSSGRKRSKGMKERREIEDRWRFVVFDVLKLLITRRRSTSTRTDVYFLLLAPPLSRKQDVSPKRQWILPVYTASHPRNCLKIGRVTGAELMRDVWSEIILPGWWICLSCTLHRYPMLPFCLDNLIHLITSHGILRYGFI
jgi:hypothetical protein